MPHAPQEFTPELTEDYYNKMARRIGVQGASAAGGARGEALARNLTGDPFEASSVGLAQQTTSNQLNDLYSGLNFDIAGLSRQERLIKEGRGAEQTFASAESEKNRALQERLARLGYDFQSGQADTAFRRQYQMLPWQIGAGAIGAGLGGGWS